MRIVSVGENRPHAASCQCNVRRYCKRLIIIIVRDGGPGGHEELEPLLYRKAA